MIASRGFLLSAHLRLHLLSRNSLGQRWFGTGRVSRSRKVIEVQLLQQRGMDVVEYTGILTAGSPGTEPET